MNNPAKVRYKIELTYKLKVQIRLVAVVNSICPKFTYFLKKSVFYRDEIYSLQNLLSRTQAGPGRSVKKEQEEISPNHVQRINLISVLISHTEYETRRIATQVFTLLITSQVLINKECSARRVGTHFVIMTYFLIII